MIYTSENNWYKWRYGTDGQDFGHSKRSQLTDPFITDWSGGSKRPTMSFKEELLYAARSTLDHYPGMRPAVFFSGGVDSELMLRAYLEIGSNPEVFIVRYEDNINIYDVSYAVVIAETLGVDYRIVDFNLRRFFENDAIEIAQVAEIDRPRMLPSLKFTECADGLIIVGHSDVRWYRPHENYSTKAEWIAQDFEHDCGCDKYNIALNRPAVYQWWKWTPQLIQSYMNLNWFKRLTNDEIPGKLGINSTKIEGFREAYPELIKREKRTGFENPFVDILVGEVQSEIERENGGLIFRNETVRPLTTAIRELV
jgi:hypothetical protein